MNDRGRSRLFRALPALLIVALATFVPLAFAVSQAPSTLDGWIALVRDEPYAGRLRFTLLQTTLATALGLALGVVVSWLLAHQRGVPRGLFAAALLVPVGVPGIAMALGVHALASDNFVAPVLIVAAHATFVLGMTCWLLTPAWSAVPRRTTEAARLLGASRIAAARALYWPALRPAVFLAVAVGLAHGVTAVSTVLVLGDPSHWTLEASLLADGGAGLSPMLAVAAAAQTALLVVLLVAHPGWPSGSGRVLSSSRLARVGGAGLLAVVALVVLLPVFALVRAAVTVDGAPTLSPLTEMGSTEIAGRGGASLLRWSATYALVSAAAATFLAWLSGPLVAAAMERRRSRWLRLGAALAMLPVLLSPLVLAVGVRDVAGEVGVDLQSTWAIMAAVHALLVYPLAVRLVAAPRRAEDLRLREAALLLGQRPGRARWRWERSRTARALVAAFLVCAALSLGEAGASTLLAPSSATPSAPAILEAARASGGAGVAGYALATVLTAVSVIAFVVGERLRPPRAAQGVGRPVEGR